MIYEKQICEKHECVIIGGGAAGMMAAVQLAGYGIDNCIIEHTGKIGSKILQTGNGKCNFTNLNMSSEMYQNKDNRLVMEVIDKFDVQHTLKFFKSIGVYYTQRMVMYIHILRQPLHYRMH